MTVIQLPDDVADLLRATAAAQNLTLEDWLKQRAADPLSAKNKEKAGETGWSSGEEKARAFVQRARSHRPMPLLSDEAVSRASLNSDRW